MISLLKGVGISRTGWLTNTVAVPLGCCGCNNNNTAALPTSTIYGLLDTKCYSSVRHNKTRDPYQVLGVHRLATKKEVKDAYIRLSKLYHPDRNPDNADAAAEFNDLRKAYEVLIAKLDCKEYVSTDLQDNTPQDDFHTGSYGQPPFRSQRKPRNIDDWVRNVERNARMREQQDRQTHKEHFKFYEQPFRQERKEDKRYDQFEANFIRNIDRGIKFHQVRNQLESEFDRRLIQRMSSKAPILYLVFIKALVMYGGRSLLILALLLLILDNSYED